MVAYLRKASVQTKYNFNGVTKQYKSFFKDHNHEYYNKLMDITISRYDTLIAQKTHTSEEVAPLSNALQNSHILIITILIIQIILML